MTEPIFEWDKAKAAANYAKHGVSFGFAMLAFDDPFAIVRVDNRRRYDEERFILIGMAQYDVLFVAYTEREDRIRLISARRATRQEHDDYVRQIP